MGHQRCSRSCVVSHRHITTYVLLSSLRNLPVSLVTAAQSPPKLCCFNFSSYHRWFTFTQLDGSLLKLLHFAQDQGLQGLWQAWPRPGSEACLTLVAYGLFQAALQHLVPGKRFEGPVTPKGNTPVYKVRLPTAVPTHCWTCCCNGRVMQPLTSDTTFLLLIDPVQLLSYRQMVSSATSSRWQRLLLHGGKLCCSFAVFQQKAKTSGALHWINASNEGKSCYSSECIATFMPSPQDWSLESRESV